MIRNSQIKRQWRELLALSHREWFSLAQIMDALPKVDRHKRTIMRDMEALSEVFPIDRRQSPEDRHTFEYRLRKPLASLLSADLSEGVDLSAHVREASALSPLTAEELNKIVSKKKFGLKDWSLTVDLHRDSARPEKKPPRRKLSRK